MTIKEVASIAGVSVATISRVINNDKSVSNETRESVLKVIQNTGYVPSGLGRNLRISSTETILVVLPSIENPFYSEIVKGIDTRSEELGFQTIFCNTYDSYESLKEYCNYIERKLAVGVIIVSPAWNHSYSFLKNRPIISCGESYENMPCVQIDIDHTKGGYDATKYLIQKGAKKIAYIGSSYVAVTSIRREKGYRQAMMEAGLEIDEKMILTGYSTYQEAYSISDKLLKDNVPEAVFASSDELAIGFYNRAIEYGYQIPKDILLMGFDNIKFAYIFNLTTIEQPRYEMGVKSVDQLYNIIKGEKAQDIVCEHKIITRRSTMR